MCVLAGARSNKIWLKSFSVPAAVPEEVVEVSAETKAAEDSGGYVQAGGCPAAIGCNGHFKNLPLNSVPTYDTHKNSHKNLSSSGFDSLDPPPSFNLSPATVFDDSLYGFTFEHGANEVGEDSFEFEPITDCDSPGQSSPTALPSLVCSLF
ncbi:hypothetical protein Pst134EA_024540 [Puccinia striiformis f. sp. tritici]|uniref:hypothetical protein n=1 Tax=Puccinia striiformis f. sp. tritici TaxID=168172 RepID=UPI002007F302|nr:hypothetical protein Pst134EA_024540 [Puccinia striiformis f. sp. tritici]KAH9453671.1 hypothetical protein Pst134EA_024540 [Puccinia striiformis f. sp. tritici]